MHPVLRALVPAALCALAACGTPNLVRPYRMDIQQGNYISQEMVSQLKPGMTKEQVRFILGTPLVTDIFHADRWDYIYFRNSQGKGREERKIAVVFENGKLARVLGDVVPAAPKAEPAALKDAAPARPAAPEPVAVPARQTAEPPPAQEKTAASEQPVQRDQAKEEQKPEPVQRDEAKEQPKPEPQSERGFFGRLLEKLGL